MHVHSPIFQGQLKEKKIRPITLIVWVLEGLKKCLKKGQKIEKNIFFVLIKYHSLTHVSTCIFQGLFKNIVFRSVALVTKKLWAILDLLFHRPDFFSALYPTL